MQGVDLIPTEITADEKKWLSKQVARYGGIKPITDATGIHRVTLHALNKKGWASKATVDKLREYIAAQMQAA